MESLEMFEGLTIIQVGMKSEVPLFRHELAKRIDSGLGSIPWILIDNDSGELANASPKLPARTYLGDSRIESIKKFGQWSHSLHHGSSLDLAMRECQTEYGLIIDPDFVIMDWSEIGLEFSKFKKSGLDFLGTPWFPIYPEKTPFSIAPHLCFVNIKNIKNFNFSWCDGIAVQPLQKLDKGAPVRKNSQLNLRELIKNEVKKTFLESKMFQIVSDFRIMRKKRSLIGINPDTGATSCRNIYSKQYFLPILSNYDLAQISRLLRFRSIRILEKFRSPSKRLLSTGWAGLETDFDLMVGNRRVEPFASTRSKLIGFHVRAYNYLLQSFESDVVMKDILNIESNFMTLLQEKKGEI
jgi:hypothetical protein